MTPRIECCSERWREQAGALIVTIQRGEYGFDIGLDDQPDLRDIAGFYQTGRGGFWVAIADDRVVGTIALKDIGGDALALRKMFVDAAYRGREAGVAAALLETAVAWAERRRAGQIVLGTTERFHAAHRFYEKHGFARIEKDALPENFLFMPADTRFYRMRFERAASPLRRYALGLWFCGIAALAAIEFRRAAFAAGAFAPTPIAWLWLAGTLVVGAVGVALLVRERRARS